MNASSISSPPSPLSRSFSGLMQVKDDKAQTSERAASALSLRGDNREANAPPPTAPRGGFTLSGALAAINGPSPFEASVTVGSDGHSKYVQAALNNFSVNNKVNNSMRGSLMDMLQDYGGMSISGTYFGRASDEDKYSIKKKIEGQKTDEIWEASEELLEKAIEEITERADDALMPTDENGNPILTDKNGNPLQDKYGNLIPTDENGVAVPQAGEPNTPPQSRPPAVNAAEVAPVSKEVQASDVAAEVSVQTEAISSSSGGRGNAAYAAALQASMSSSTPDGQAISLNISV